MIIGLSGKTYKMESHLQMLLLWGIRDYEKVKGTAVVGLINVELVLFT